MARICVICKSPTTNHRPTHHTCDNPLCKRVVLLKAGRILMDDIHEANKLRKEDPQA